MEAFEERKGTLSGLAVASLVLGLVGPFLGVMALAAGEAYHLVLSRAHPEWAHLAALMFHQATRTPWIANWNDPQPWHKFPPPYGDGPSSPMTPANRRFYRVVAAHCAWHTFPCERLRRYMCSYMPGDVEAKSSVVPHIAMARFSAPPIPHNGFSICYAGSLRPPRDPRVLLEGAKRFALKVGHQEGFNVRFLVDWPDDAADAARAIGVGDLLSIEPARPYEEMPEALARSDVLVIIEAPVTEGIFLPSKFVDYVQTGRPILALSPTVGTLPDILSTYGGGMAVDGSSPSAVADAIETFYRHWKAGSLDVVYGSSKLVELFSQRRVLGQYAELFRHVLARHGGAT
jgi:glycosyltransferase involved in cell wall biosynthesis